MRGENEMILGALEAGGTKMVMAVGNEKGEIFERRTIPTESPENTMPAMIDYFREKKIEALGIGSFGPVDVREGSETYGRILDTPKTAWQQYDLGRNLQEALQVPVKVDTDVNASCLGEMTFGDAKGLKNVIYITIGTGIGAGVAVNGGLIHGMLHPEAGHILLRKSPKDSYEGKCPYHKTCFEGLASGPAIEERYGKKAWELAENKEVWELEADYIAQALANYILVYSPERIILGGRCDASDTVAGNCPLQNLRISGGLYKHTSTANYRKLHNVTILRRQSGDSGGIAVSCDGTEIRGKKNGIIRKIKVVSGYGLLSFSYART
jgi:fructokinase